MLKFAISAAIVAAVAAATAHSAQQPASGAPDAVIHAGSLIDGSPTMPRVGVSIVIAGDRIVGVEKRTEDRQR